MFTQARNDLVLVSLATAGYLQVVIRDGAFVVGGTVDISADGAAMIEAACRAVRDYVDLQKSTPVT